MATRKSRAIEREPMQAMGRTPTEATPRARAHTGKRQDVPVRAPAPTPVSAPMLRLVKAPKQTRQTAASSATIATVVPGRSSAATATQLPLRFPQPLVALPSAVAAPVAHADLPPRRSSGMSSAASTHSVARPAATSAHPSPAARPPTVRARFGELREALAEGFEIVQPIFARPLWSVSDDSTTAFNFVLRRERTTRLVTVPEGRTIQRFIRDRQLLVDYRR